MTLFYKPHLSELLFPTTTVAWKEMNLLSELQKGAGKLGDTEEVQLTIPKALKTVIKALATHCMSYMRKLKGRRLLAVFQYYHQRCRTVSNVQLDSATVTLRLKSMTAKNNPCITYVLYLCVNVCLYIFLCLFYSHNT